MGLQIKALFGSGGIQNLNLFYFFDSVNGKEMREAYEGIGEQWVEVHWVWGFVQGVMGLWINSYNQTAITIATAIATATATITITECSQFKQWGSLRKCSRRRRGCSIGSASLLVAKRSECCFFVSSPPRFSSGFFM